MSIQKKKAQVTLPEAERQRRRSVWESLRWLWSLPLRRWQAGRVWVECQGIEWLSVQIKNNSIVKIVKLVKCNIVEFMFRFIPSYHITSYSFSFRFANADSVHFGLCRCDASEAQPVARHTVLIRDSRYLQMRTWHFTNLYRLTLPVFLFFCRFAVHFWNLVHATSRTTVVQASKSTWNLHDCIILHCVLSIMSFFASRCFILPLMCLNSPGFGIRRGFHRIPKREGMCSQRRCVANVLCCPTGMRGLPKGESEDLSLMGGSRSVLPTTSSTSNVWRDQ